MHALVSRLEHGGELAGGSGVSTTEHLELVMAAQPDVGASDQSREDPYLAHIRESEDDPGYGWVRFAGLLLLILGSLSLIFGLAAIGDSQFIAAHPRYILGTRHTLGWTGVVLGVLELAAGFGVLVKNQPSRWVGVAVLALGAILELLAIQSYPFWSLSLFALAILAMYGLIVHGEKISRPTT
jgi:hypothetical protein